jgi:ubiquinone/menaquinone biosynthesis C-methylase UbiE
LKENRYDDGQFFEKYRRFPRSVGGLSSVGEWRELQKMLPDFHGKRVLDIGCGFGWHCLYAAEQGALHVIGTDISEKMLSIAREKNGHPHVQYKKIPMEDIDYPADSFDVVISSLALHYTPDFQSICQKIHRFLSPQGSFIFSVEHPIFTAHGAQDWIYDERHKILHWPVDRYFSEGRRHTIFLGEEVIKYHKTLATYLGTLLKEGFVLTGVVEPKPLDTAADAQDELRRPMMLLVSAQKP